MTRNTLCLSRRWGILMTTAHKYEAPPSAKVSRCPTQTCLWSSHRSRQQEQLIHKIGILRSRLGSPYQRLYRVLQKGRISARSIPPKPEKNDSLQRLAIMGSDRPGCAYCNSIYPNLFRLHADQGMSERQKISAIQGISRAGQQ